MKDYLKPFIVVIMLSVSFTLAGCRSGNSASSTGSNAQAAHPAAGQNNEVQNTAAGDSSAGADPALVFGPTQYTRTTGMPNTFTDTFAYPSCGTQDCNLVAVNGNDDGSNRVSSGSVSLNGNVIVSPSDLNQNVDQVVKPVALTDQNQVAVTLASKPGSFLTVHLECAAPPAKLELQGPGTKIQDPSTLLVAVRVVNDGTMAVDNVTVTAISLAGGTLTSPALPDNLATIQPASAAILNAGFSGGPFTPDTTYTLNVEGTYEVNGSSYCFSLTTDVQTLPASPGSAVLGTVNVAPGTVTGAPYPPVTPPVIEPDEENGQRWTEPATPSAPGTPTSTSTEVTPAPFGDPPGIVFTANGGIDFSAGTITTAEPSGARGGGVIFATTNFRASFSKDGGSTWIKLNPTTIFPNTGAGGGCWCDHVVQYVPSINRFIWLIQGNGYRIASASPEQIISSNGTAWTYWDLTPGVFGQSAGTGFDYPDVSVGANSLYISWNVGFPNCPAGCTWGHQVVRTSLAGIQAGGTITLGYTNPADARNAWGAHLTQNTGSGIYWAGHDGTDELTVWSLEEGSNTYSWRNKGITSYSASGVSSTTPDGKDWMSECGGGFPGTDVIGATRSSNTLWFAWMAGTDDNFSRAHIEMVQLNLNDNFNKLQQVQIWNNDYAFGYPALTTNACTGEVGMSFEYGGPSNYQDHVVGIWGDYVAYRTTGSNVGTCRFGDYVTIRQAVPTTDNPGNMFDAFGYGVNDDGTGAKPDIHYIQFGRPASSCVIIK